MNNLNMSSIRHMKMWKATLVTVPPLLVIIGVLWVPVVFHYHVSETRITANHVSAARAQPSDHMIAELKPLIFGQAKLDSFETEIIVASADDLFQGRFSLPGFESRELGIPFNPADLESGPAIWQLRYASLLLPAILVEAFERTREDHYLLAARDFLLAWQEFESKAWIPKGFLWNDHAVAARVVPLADFWSLYRKHLAFREADAQRILELAARTGKMLARPDHYTFATNHGKFQSLALFHLALSFPELPGFQSYLPLARERLDEQMEYLVAPDGAVLEHTAEYHHSGIERLSVAFRYLTLAGMEIPDSWRSKYKKAKALHAAMMRPDGTLPRLGNTKPRAAANGTLSTQLDHAGAANRPRMEQQWEHEKSFTLCPIGGFAAWWHDQAAGGAGELVPTHTVVNWSHYPGHAHKHADELSVNAWADGIEWLTSTGFWPDGVPPGRTWARSWPGSNAPHLRGEPYASIRELVMLSHGHSASMTALEVQRNNGDGFRARRQVITLAGGTWLIIDSFADVVSRPVDTIWTLDPRLSLQQETQGQSMRLSTDDSSLEMHAWFIGSEEQQLSLYRGSLDPPMGWVVDPVASTQVLPANAVQVAKDSSGSWSAAVFRLLSRDTAGPGVALAEMDYWHSPDDWKLLIHDDVNPVQIRREGNALTTTGDGQSIVNAVLKLKSAPDVSSERLAIRQAFAAAEQKYGSKFIVAIDFRSWLTMVLLGLLIAQEVFFLVYRRLVNFHYWKLRALAASGWIALGVAIHTRYFA